MRKIPRIPTIFGVFVLVLGTALGVFFVSQQQLFKLGATGQFTPRDVKVTNVTDSSFTVSWTTDKASVGKVSWGENSSVGRITGDEKLSTIHSSTITGLVASKTYYFKINSGGSLYDNQGTAWITQTRATTATQTAVFAGTILVDDGTPAQDSIVYISGTNIPDLSAATGANGNWSISAQIPLDVKLDSILEIFVQGGDKGVATAQIAADTAKSTPPITLGKTYDFRQVVASDNQGPSTELNLPENNIFKRTGFGESSASASTATGGTVTLKSIKDQEKISTTKPEFFGDGPAGTTITIKVESNPIIQTVKIPQTGTWRWSIPSNLPEGNHTITISWKDASGILHTLTRSFTVLAAGDEPAFESTPSATPIVTATPKPTATPLLSPTPTATATATATPTIKPTATPKPTTVASSESALPSAGSPFDSIALLLMGGLLTGASFVLYKKGSS